MSVSPAYAVEISGRPGVDPAPWYLVEWFSHPHTAHAKAASLAHPSNYDRPARVVPPYGPAEVVSSARRGR